MKGCLRKQLRERNIGGRPGGLTGFSGINLAAETDSLRRAEQAGKRNPRFPVGDSSPSIPSWNQIAAWLVKMQKLRESMVSAA
jgi:hypothetical protein